MTLAEQRAALIEEMELACFVSPDRNDNHPSKWRRICEQQLAAISAAGFSIVGPEVTEEMRELSAKMEDGPYCGVDEWWSRMLAAADLVRKPE